MSVGPVPTTFPDLAELSGMHPAPVPALRPAEDLGDDASSTLERIRQVRSRLETNAVTVKLTARPVQAPVSAQRNAPSLRYVVGATMVALLTVGLLWATSPNPAGVEAVAPPDPTALMAKGFERLDVDPDAAVSLFHEALSVAPQDPALMSGLGQALLAAGRHSEARTWLCRGVRAPGAIGHAAEAALLRHRMHCP